MFNKILVANRGEIALRVIRTCREMGIPTVSVFSTADEDSLHTRFADEAVCIGPAPSRDSYLNIPAILSAAEVTNVDAIHPGYGFLAENSEFASVCEELNIRFIGSQPSMIQTMGDKVSAKAAMNASGVPIIPGSDGVITTLKDCKAKAREIGYPVILKATAGGGGRGMRIVEEEAKLSSRWEICRQEASSFFANDGLYLEKFIPNPRHIEFQILADQHGHACHLSERECSIQRRHQKLLEESPSPFITYDLRQKMGKMAVQAMEKMGYQGAGTIEFLVDSDKNFYFMEMNTRIQVEHPVTEEVTGIDIVREQIKIAAGEKIPKRDHFPQGHCIECRINAEDPYADFAPSPGTIENLHFPGGHGVRVDSHIYESYKIPSHYDSMIAKLIVRAPSRAEAISKMRSALDETIIEGVRTTIPFHRSLLQNKDFQQGNFDTNFLERFDLRSP